MLSAQPKRKVLFADDAIANGKDREQMRSRRKHPQKYFTTQSIQQHYRRTIRNGVLIHGDQWAPQQLVLNTRYAEVRGQLVSFLHGKMDEENARYRISMAGKIKELNQLRGVNVSHRRIQTFFTSDDMEEDDEKMRYIYKHLKARLQQSKQNAEETKENAEETQENEEGIEDDGDTGDTGDTQTQQMEFNIDDDPMEQDPFA